MEKFGVVKRIALPAYGYLFDIRNIDNAEQNSYLVAWRVP